MGEPFYTYVLRCSDGSYYVGHTDDLQKRIAEHQHGGKCRYTSGRRPVSLVWSQQFPTCEEAKAAENQIKKWGRAKKEALLKHDFDQLRREAKKKTWDTYHERHKCPDLKAENPRRRGLE